MKPGRRIPLASAAAVLLAVCVAVGIYALTEQPPDATSLQSGAVNDALVRLFGGAPFLYDSKTGLWLGISIRHWAHAVEFWLLGLPVALAAWLAARPRVAVAGAVSLAVCAACSIFDQCHKLFVPGRHFDFFDLVMDALGYTTAIAMVLLVAWAVSALRRRHR